MCVSFSIRLSVWCASSSYSSHNKGQTSAWQRKRHREDIEVNCSSHKDVGKRKTGRSGLISAIGVAGFEEARGMNGGRRIVQKCKLVQFSVVKFNYDFSFLKINRNFKLQA